MPNEACNTSIFFFLKSNCKYLRTISFWESKPAKDSTVEQRLIPAVFLREPWRRSRRNSSQSDRSEIWIGWILLCWLSPASRRGNGLISLCKFVLSDQGEGKKKPSWNNQSTSIFQLVHFHLVTVFSCVGGGWWHGVWTTHNTGAGGSGWILLQHLRFLRWGLAEEEWSDYCTLSPLTFVSFGLHKRQRLDPTVDVSRTVSVQLWTADGSEHSGGLWCTWAHRCIKYWSRSLWVLSCTCTCFTVCLLFYCMCVCPDRSLALLLHFCFGVVWKSPALCLK